MIKFVKTALLEPPKFWGRRGSVLFLMGLAWILLGLSVLLSGVQLDFDETGLWHLALPPFVRAALWFLTGALAVAFSFRRMARWDGLGYGALIFMPLERTASYGWGWFVSLPIWPDGLGYSPGWTGALVWIVVAVLIYTCAGWREPSDEPILIIERRDSTRGTRPGA